MRPIENLILNGTKKRLARSIDGDRSSMALTGLINTFCDGNMALVCVAKSLCCEVYGVFDGLVNALR